MERKMNNKEKYLEKHCNILEKENKELKEENLALKIQILSYSQKLNTSVDDASSILKSAYLAKNTYENLCVELQNKLYKLNSYLSYINTKYHIGKKKNKI